MRLARIARLAAALVIASASLAGASERKPLPSFKLQEIDGIAVESRTLATDATWLLVYVQARCAPCEALLTRMDSDERASALRVVIVGGGMNGEALAALAAKYPNLQASRWLADPERVAIAALGVQANPTVFGLRASSIEWRLAGTVRNDRELDSILFTWLEKR